MTEINFNELIFITDWARALDQLLQDAKQAIQNNDFEERQLIQETLADFKKQSPPECAALDKIADRAIDDLFISITSDALTAIMARLGELKDATKLISGVTAANSDAAKDLQFKNVISALDKAKAATNTLRQLEMSMTNPDNSLLQKINALLTAIEGFSASIA